jgi:hypothetical protein
MVEVLAPRLKYHLRDFCMVLSLLPDPWVHCDHRRARVCGIIEQNSCQRERKKL